MNRAKKRAVHKSDKKVCLTYSELEGCKRAIANAASDYYVDILTTCFLTAERELYGFGETRLKRTYEYVEDLTTKIVNGEISVEDLKTKLGEIGVNIKRGNKSEQRKD